MSLRTLVCILLLAALATPPALAQSGFVTTGDLVRHDPATAPYPDYLLVAIDPNRELILDAEGRPGIRRVRCTQEGCATFLCDTIQCSDPRPDRSRKVEEIEQGRLKFGSNPLLLLADREVDGWSIRLGRFDAGLYNEFLLPTPDKKRMMVFLKKVPGAIEAIQGDRFVFADRATLIAAVQVVWQNRGWTNAGFYRVISDDAGRAALTQEVAARIEAAKPLQTGRTLAPAVRDLLLPPFAEPLRAAVENGVRPGPRETALFAWALQTLAQCGAIADDDALHQVIVSALFAAQFEDTQASMTAQFIDWPAATPRLSRACRAPEAAELAQILHDVLKARN